MDPDLPSDDPDEPDDPTVVPKPDELLALHDVTEEMFETLRAWFDVPSSVTLDLRSVDSAVTELGDPLLIAAMAMRKLQALHLLATPGVMTTTDVVVNLVSDLGRALHQAPGMRLKVQAAEADWDAEFARLAGGNPPEGPTSTEEADEEADRFEALHGCLIMAVHAVLRVSDGEIRYLV